MRDGGLIDTSKAVQLFGSPPWSLKILGKFVTSEEATDISVGVGFDRVMAARGSLKARISLMLRFELLLEGLSITRYYPVPSQVRKPDMLHEVQHKVFVLL